MTRLSEIEGIGGAYAEKLKAVGINSIESLLELCKTPKGRGDLALKADISEKLILKWTNRADLARIKGVGGQYADLLEASGVDTVPELAHRVPENLIKKMTEINAERKLVRKLPVLKQVSSWISQAKELPRIIKY
jgi:predicted flap endonuclease-1-like 5' DNA nuclease